MKAKSLDDILKGFELSAAEDSASLRERRPVTIWLPVDAKARYDALQRKSDRRFSKKARELLLAAIEIAETQAG